MFTIPKISPFSLKYLIYKYLFFRNNSNYRNILLSPKLFYLYEQHEKKFFFHKIDFVNIINIIHGFGNELDFVFITEQFRFFLINSIVFIQKQ